jgi:hypothetical protein
MRIVDSLKYSTGALIGISSARLQLRDSTDNLVYEWNTSNGTAAISGSSSESVTLNSVPAATTATWSAGMYSYDLEITTLSGDTWTVLEGVRYVDPDKTR